MRPLRQMLSTKYAKCLLIVTLLISACSYGTAPSTNGEVRGSIGITAFVDTSGAYTIRSQTPTWTFGGNIGHTLTDITIHTGANTIGSYKEIVFHYQPDAARSGSIRVYNAKPIVLFTDTYLSDAHNTVPFPHLTVYPKNLYHLTYTGAFAHNTFRSLADDSPWMYFDTHGNAFMLSAASDFMLASTTRENDGSIVSGINPAITRLPQGFTHKTFLFIAQGINNLYDIWGHAMTDLQGKIRPANDADATLNYLGYWTDTGAAYYYNFDQTKGYIGSLLAVRDSFQREGIPLGYMEIDSWWYPKGASDTWQGDPNNNRGGIFTYNAAPALFPDGLHAFQQQLRLPLGTHARWIDPSSPYRTQYKMSNNVSTDPRYWNDIAAYLQSSGVITYKQDWLNQLSLPATNLSDPEAFMNNMANAMATHDITIQYCLALPRHFLQSSKYNNITTIRVSNDHFTRDKWDQFLYTSRLAGALGVWPYADVFMSTEKDNLLLSTLSAGIVGVGDAIGTESKANLFQTIRADGVIVKPDVPIVPIDDMYIQDAQGLHNPMVASTYTDHEGMKAYYVVAYKRGSNTTVTFMPASLGLNGNAYVYNYFTSIGQIVKAGGSYSDTVTDASYYIVAPIGRSGIAFLGDAGKFVSLGKKRITQLTDNGQVHATITFASGERAVTLHGYSPSAPKVTASTGTVGDIVYNNVTHLFSFGVSPDYEGFATITVNQEEQ